MLKTEVLWELDLGKRWNQMPGGGGGEGGGTKAVQTLESPEEVSAPFESECFTERIIPCLNPIHPILTLTALMGLIFAFINCMFRWYFDLLFSIFFNRKKVFFFIKKIPMAASPKA